MAAAVRRCEQEGHFREQHAHEPDAASRRTCRCCSSPSVRDRTAIEFAVYLLDTGEAVHPRALSRRRRLREPRFDRRRARRRWRWWRAAAVAAAAAGRWRRRWAGPAVGRRLQRVLPGHDQRPGTRNEVGPKTFIDQVAIKTGEKKRIYESDNSDVFERISIDARPRRDGKFIVTREEADGGAAAIPGRHRPAQAADAERGRHARIMTKMRIERFTVERADGFKFRTTVNLPANYNAGTPPPALFWFYPREFTGPGVLRPARSHVQQEHLPELRDAVDGVLRPPRLRRSSSPTRRSSARRGR